MSNVSEPQAQTALPPQYHALVIGASGTIGQAFVNYFQVDAQCANVVCVSRSTVPGFDLTHANSVDLLVPHVKPAVPYHIIVDATGALTIDGMGPEKSLSALDEKRLMNAFQINTIGPALLMRHLTPLLAPQGAIYAKLSARVGSISDNQKGGWYGYRAAKAALNMMLQTAALELQRRQPAHRVVALQPGTVASTLSQPFVSADHPAISASESVQGMMQAIRALQPKSGAHFVDYRGNAIDW